MSKLVAIHRRRELIALVGMCFLAAMLRLGSPEIVEFKRDEANLSRLSIDLATGEQFPWLGIGSSVGFPNSPINVYLFALPYTISHNPLIASLFVGFLNIVAVALLWRMTRRYFGETAALMAGLFYAVSPWAAIYSRKIWAQDVLPPFVMATVFTGILGFLEEQPKRWSQLLHVPLLAITVQIHFGAFTLIPLTGLILGLGWRNIRREFWLGLGIAGLACLPYLYGLYDADMLHTASIRESLDRPTEETAVPVGTVDSAALDYAWFTVAGTDIHSLAGEHQFQRYLDSVPSVYALFKLIPLSVVITALGMGVTAYRRRSRLLVVLLAWLVLPVAAFIYTWAAPQPHYMIPMMPVAFLVLGVGIDYVQRHLKTVVYVSVAVVVILQAWLLLALFGFLGSHNTIGAFGTPLGHLLDVRSAVMDSQASRIIVVSDGDTPPFDGEAAVWNVLLTDLPAVGFVASEYLWPLPVDDKTMLLVSPRADDNWLTNTTHPPNQVFNLRPDEGQYQLWNEIPFDTPNDLQNIDARFENGVRLVGLWREDEATLWLVWELPVPRDETQYIVFVHTMDESDNRLDQVDLPFWQQSYWQEGDRLLMRTTLPAYAETQSLRIGMYTLISENNYRTSELLDSEGRYVDQWFVVRLNQ